MVRGSGGAAFAFGVVCLASVVLVECGALLSIEPDDGQADVVHADAADATDSSESKGDGTTAPDAAPTLDASLDQRASCADGGCGCLSGARVVVFRSARGPVPVHYCYSLDASSCTGFPAPDGPAFRVEPAPATGLVPLYRCRSLDGTDPNIVLSEASDCGGIGVVAETLGYVVPAPSCGSVPLYRFQIAGELFYTVSESEGLGASGTELPPPFQAWVTP